MPRRWSVGARFSMTGWSLMTSSRMSQTIGSCCSTISFACLMVVQFPLLSQRVVDERLEQLERHLLRQSALMQLELGANHNHRTSGVVHALAEQVLAEAPLFALQRVGERLQWAVIGATQNAPAASVVEQSVDRFLQHALLVAHNDFGSMQVHQLLQPVVPVDDAPVKVIQIGGGKASAIQRNQWTQLRWNHRKHVQDHPLRFVAALAGGLG